MDCGSGMIVWLTTAIQHGYLLATVDANGHPLSSTAVRHRHLLDARVVSLCLYAV